MFMSQGQTRTQGLQTASPITHVEPCRRQNDPPCSSSPLCVSILIGDGVCARAAMHTRARAAPG